MNAFATGVPAKPLKSYHRPAVYAAAPVILFQSVRLNFPFVVISLMRSSIEEKPMLVPGELQESPQRCRGCSGIVEYQKVQVGVVLDLYAVGFVREEHGFCLGVLLSNHMSCKRFDQNDVAEPAHAGVAGDSLDASDTFVSVVERDEW